MLFLSVTYFCVWMKVNGRVVWLPLLIWPWFYLLLLALYDSLQVIISLYIWATVHYLKFTVVYSCILTSIYFEINVMNLRYTSKYTLCLNINTNPAQTMRYLENNHFALENGHEVARFFSHADPHLNRLTTVLLVQSDRLICSSSNFILRRMTSLWDVFKKLTLLLYSMLWCSFIISTFTWVLLYFSSLLWIPYHSIKWRIAHTVCHQIVKKTQTCQIEQFYFCILPPWAKDSTPYKHKSWLWNRTKSFVVKWNFRVNYGGRWAKKNWWEKCF